MPVFIAAGVAAAGMALMDAGILGIGAFLAGNAMLLTNVALLLGGMALSYEQRAAAARKAKDAYNAAQTDRMVNVVTAIGPRELVLGRVRKGGTVFYRASTGTNKQTLIMCIALAAHECDAVETIYFNDKPVTLDGSGNVTSAPYALSSRTTRQVQFTGSSVTLTPPSGGSIDSSTIAVTYTTEAAGSASIDHTLSGNTVSVTDVSGGTTVYTCTYQETTSTSKAKITVHLGGAGQTVDPRINALFGSDWPTTSTATGICYLVCEFTYDQTAFPSGVPNVTAVIRGAKCYDPRTGSVVWTDNPAILARQILIHPSFGKRTSLTSDEEARISAAANACDTSVTYIGGGSYTRPLYTAGYVAQYGSAPKQALDDICQAMAGMWAYAGGQFYIKAGVYTSPVITLTDSDIGSVKRSEDGSVTQSPIAISTHKARASRFNTVTPRIWDSAQDYKEVALQPLQPSSLVTRDGVTLAQEVTMPAVNFALQALNVAGIMLRDDRDPLTVTLPFKLKAYPVELFDTVALTISRYGWSAKPFIVLKRSWTLEGLIQLTLKETDASIFQMDASFNAQGYASNTNLPQPWSISPPSGISAASGPAQFLYLNDGTVLPRVKVTWNAITDQSILQGGYIEVLYRLAVDGPTAGWRLLRVAASETAVYLTDLRWTDIVFIQLRCRNTIAISDWSPMLTYAVTTNTNTPGAPTALTATAILKGINVAWTNPTDADFHHTEVWMSTDNVQAHASQVASIAGTSYVQAPLAVTDGARYFWVRAVNNSGNKSGFTGPANATAGTATGDDLTVGVVDRIRLSTTSGVFHVDTSGTASPTSITLTATTDISATISWSVTAGTATLTGSGSTRSLAYSDLSTSTATIQASVTDPVTSNTYTAQITIAKVVDGASGSGSQYAKAHMYQWASVAPSAPTGSSTYTWATALVSGYTGGGGWSATIPSNPGTSGLLLWDASVPVSDSGSATTTSFSWSGAAVNGISQNGASGADGTQAATLSVYQWALSTPTISGTSTYTWSSASFTPVPTGWTVSSTTAPGPGYNLYKASVNITDAATATTTSANWSGASIIVAGTSPYNGASSRTTYARIAAGANPTSGSIATSGNSTFPTAVQSYATWGNSSTNAQWNVAWSGSDPSPGSSNTLYQSDGIYDPSTNQTTWTTPYVSELKVGQLSAIQVNTGGLNVDSGITVASTGSFALGQTAYNTGTGIWFGYSGSAYKISVGIAGGAGWTWDGSALSITGALKGSSTILIGSGGTPSGGKFEVNSSGVAWFYSGITCNPGAIFSSVSSTTDTTQAILATSYNNTVAVYGLVDSGNSNAGAHGVRGWNANQVIGGVRGTGGIIGCSNGYDFYADGAGTNYGPFTGSHDAVVPNGTSVAVGQIVVDTGTVVERAGWSGTICQAAVSSSPNQAGVLGLVVNVVALAEVEPASFVVSRAADGTATMTSWYTTNAAIYQFVAVNALGEGQIQVCGEGGNIALGDLIVTSSTAGVGMKQSDNVMRSYTVAKSREAVTFTDTTTPQTIACTYHCA